tara:strand:+ start:127 stop:378 length:252 start_codon:yes stop_codon:yes gene_type:complete
MDLQIRNNLINTKLSKRDNSVYKNKEFSKDYIDFLNDAGWSLERKLPSNRNNYSDLLEDTEWQTNISEFKSSIHYRRDLDALS